MAGPSFQRCSVCCQVSDRTVCVYTLHSSESQEATQSVTAVIQLFIHCKLVRSPHFVRQCTRIVALTAARSPFRKRQSFCFSGVLPTEPAFMFLKHLQSNPPRPRSCSPPLSARGSLVSQAREWESALITGCTCKSTVLHTAETGLLPRTKGWYIVFVLR